MQGLGNLDSNRGLAAGLAVGRRAGESEFPRSSRHDLLDLYEQVGFDILAGRWSIGPSASSSIASERIASAEAAASTAEDVCDRLAAAMHLDGVPIRVALGVADASSLPYYEELETRLKERPDVVEILRYRIGPSVGALTGPGTAGGFWYAAE